jgi:hypothetical protein
MCVDPKDKVYGILGVLARWERNKFEVDYRLSTREVYINIARYILQTTQKLDVICASFSEDPNFHQLPTWVPDWENSMMNKPVSKPYDVWTSYFTAAGPTKGDFTISPSGDILTFSAITIDEINEVGIPSPEFTTLETIILIFHNWRSVFLRSRREITYEDHEAFCKSVSCHTRLAPTPHSELVHRTYQTFASLTRENDPSYPLDLELSSYADTYHPDMLPQRRELLYEHIFNAMQGRRFMVLKNGTMGLGSPRIRRDDVVCVPFGCQTPVVVRREGDYWVYVGDAYVEGYMYGRAINDLDAGRRRIERLEVH